MSRPTGLKQDDGTTLAGVVRFPSSNLFDNVKVIVLSTTFHHQVHLILSATRIEITRTEAY